MVAIYSTFLQRAYDQLIHDVAMQNLPVRLRARSRRPGRRRRRDPRRRLRHRLPALHSEHGRAWPPADENECRQMLTTAFQHDRPGCGALSARRRRRRRDRARGWQTLPFGKGEIAARSGKRRRDPGLRHHARIRRWPRPSDLNATVANMRFVKPLDIELVLQLARTHDALVTVEEGCSHGRRRGAVAEALAAAGIVKPLLHLGLPDKFIDHGDPAQLLAACGLDAQGHRGIDPAALRQGRTASGRQQLTIRQVPCSWPT